MELRTFLRKSFLRCLHQIPLIRKRWLKKTKRKKKPSGKYLLEVECLLMMSYFILNLYAFYYSNTLNHKEKIKSKKNTIRLYIVDVGKKINDSNRNLFRTFIYKSDRNYKNLYNCYTFLMKKVKNGEKIVLITAKKSEIVTKCLETLVKILKNKHFLGAVYQIYYYRYSSYEVYKKIYLKTFLQEFKKLLDSIEDQ